jgi:long-chain acyl-CoA synthetase
VAPQPIENVLKQNRFVDQAVLLGDRRKFIAMLLVPEFPNLEEWARAKGLPTQDRRTLLGTPQVQAMLEAELDRELSGVSRVERPKKVVLLDTPFTIEDGSLTPTQKVKRRVVEKRFQAIVDALYDESADERTFFTPW